MRFREYLGEQYSKKDNVEIIKVEGDNENDEIPLPIYSLYFLGSDAGIDGVPVLEVNPVVRDVATGKVINQRSRFIESLNHRSWIVQIKYLKEPRRTELEQLLSIFDQGKYTSNIHILKIKEEDFPEKYHPLIRRLKKAASSPKIQKKMDNEDLYLDQFKDTVRKETRGLRKEVAQKDKIIAQKDNTIAEKDNTIAEKDNALAEKDNALAEKDQENAELRRLLQQAGIDIPKNNK
jgi:septal ring factor EnvC (AmiA/AmiB activator)